jgi:hypothetical protein
MMLPKHYMQLPQDNLKLGKNRNVKISLKSYSIFKLRLIVSLQIGKVKFITTHSRVSFKNLVGLKMSLAYYKGTWTTSSRGLAVKATDI